MAVQGCSKILCNRDNNVQLDIYINRSNLKLFLNNHNNQDKFILAYSSILRIFLNKNKLY